MGNLIRLLRDFLSSTNRVVSVFIVAASVFPGKDL